jgi:membrane protease subunit HflK
MNNKNELESLIYDILSDFKNKINFKLPGVSFVVITLTILWLLSGIYTVAPDEIGVVTRFGKFEYTTNPGLHYRLPYPIESVLKPKVAAIQKMEIGYRTISIGPPAVYRDVEKESLMLTGDENIISIQFILQYRIKDPIAYLFNVKDVRKTVKDVAEAAMREVVGKTNIDEVLTSGKFRVQQDVKHGVQSVLDSYKAGITIEVVQLQDVHPPKSVIQAFRDVASAKEDKVKIINEAEGYRNDILPKAKGDAQKMINQAIAYKQSKILKAEGDTSRFLQILKQYEKAKEITKTRLYLETMENLLPGVTKIITDKDSSKNITKVLPLKNFLQLNKQEIK